MRQDPNIIHQPVNLPLMGHNRTDLIFPMVEFQNRLDKVRDKMSEEGIDALVTTTPENIFYLTGYQTLGYWYFQALIVPMDKPPFIVLRGLENPNVHGRTYLAHSYPYMDHEDPIERFRDAIVSFELHDKKLGVELHSYFLRNTEFAQAKKLLPDVTFTDVSGMVEDLRKVKSGLEIENLKKAGRYTHMGIVAALQEAKIGNTENDIAAAFYKGSLDAGSHYMAVPPFVASGPRSYLAHATFMNRTLEPNEFILLEGAGAYNRYHAPCMRTIYLGKPLPWFLEIETILQEALSTAIKSMIPGVTAAEVDHINQKMIEKNHFGGKQTSRTGYSIGIAFAPDWGEGHIISLVEGENTVLKENMTFHVLSYIEIPESKHSKASRFGLTDSVYVTQEGGKSLINLPYKIQFSEY